MDDFPDLSKMDAGQATSLFQNPEFLREAAMIAFKHGRPDGVAWLERSHQAAKEGAFEALQLLEQGDGPGAIQAFNRSGRIRGATTAQKNGDGTWTIGDNAGKSMTINPAKMRMSLLSPKDYYEEQRQQRREQAETQHRERQYGLDRRRLELDAERNRDQRAFQQGTLDNRAEMTRVQADAAAGRLEQTAINADLSRQLREARDDRYHKIFANARKEAAELAASSPFGARINADHAGYSAVLNAPGVRMAVFEDGKVKIAGGNKILYEFNSREEFVRATGQPLPPMPPAKTARTDGAVEPAAPEPAPPKKLEDQPQTKPWWMPNSRETDRRPGKLFDTPEDRRKRRIVIDDPLLGVSP